MLAHLVLAVLVTLNVVSLSLSEIPQLRNPASPNSIQNLESKDVLLQMLENKLKEIKDIKKRKDSKNGNSEVLPKNVDIKLRSNGISSVGEIDLLMRNGKNGQGAVNITAEGISNVGRIQLAVGLGENGIQIPGLSNIFDGLTLRSENSNNDQNQLIQLKSKGEFNIGFRKQNNVNMQEINTIATADIGPVKANVEAKAGNNGVESNAANPNSASKEIINSVAAKNIEAMKINAVAKVESPVVTDNNGANTYNMGALNEKANIAVAVNQGMGISNPAYDPSVSYGFVTQGIRK